MNQIDEIKILWEREKEMEPYLYVIRYKEIDHLFIHISTLEQQLKNSNSIREAEKKILIDEITKNTILEQRAKELQENRSKIIQELNKQLNEAESRVKELEVELKLNTSMLAKQCDLAREAEIKTKNKGDGILIVDIEY